ncbi:MAG: ABC transporter ATP-binding protein [Lachnospiraceae bacterium]
MMVWPILAAGESITFFSQGLASLKRIAAIFDEKPDIISKEGTDSKIAIEGEIEFSNLTFAYPDQPQAKILKDINLHTNKGNTLAIIGRTGSGKSSVASLLLRLFETEPGMIRIDGHNIQDIPLHTLREAIAYVPQENFLFSDTIANNLAFGVADKTREQIEQAAKDACIHENIIDFTDGYETVVGERGVTLSGGQKQRCSIARALLKDAPILILDDALSAVDTNTEEKILSNLKKNRVGKTTIIIAHRISTIQSSDQIMVLEEGNMAECGTHQDLINIPNGIYRSIYEKQQLEKQLEQA